MLTPGSARADAGFNLERVTLAPANSRWFAADSLVSEPASLNPNYAFGVDSIALRLDGAWAHQPLVVRRNDANLSEIVREQVALTLHASFNPLRQLRLPMDFPWQVYAPGGVGAAQGALVLPPLDDVAAGNLAAEATYVIDTPANDALRFGVSVRFRFPTGEQDDFVGDATTSGGVLLAMTGDVGYLSYALSLGGRLRSKQPFVGDTIGSEVTAVPAIGLQNLARTFLVGLEVPMALNLVANERFSQSGLAADPIVALHWWPVPQVGLRAGVGTGLTAAVGEPRWRVLAGLQWSPWLDTPPPPPPPPPPPDTDADGVPDADDHCPNGEPGDPNLLGCFAGDGDGDGVIDPDDHCPQEPGTAEYQGCPTPTKVVVQEDRISVNEKIEFEVNKDTLKPESFATLDEIVKVMQSHPKITALQVQGHTDTSGRLKSNRKLSEARAASVVKYLVEHGVAAERLQAKGFGPDQPLVPNDTPAHRSTNRRVDFIIVGGEGTSSAPAPAPDAAPNSDGAAAPQGTPPPGPGEPPLPAPPPDAPAAPEAAPPGAGDVPPEAPKAPDAAPPGTDDAPAPAAPDTAPPADAPQD